MTLTLNGRALAVDPLGVQSGVLLQPNVLVGAVFGSEPHTGWTFRYDNVTIDTR
jgi:hypothetical protein